MVRNNARGDAQRRQPHPDRLGHASTRSTGSDTGTYSQVQYLDTGIILKVRPRITRDGMVFLDIVQEVSTPDRRSPTSRQRPHRHPQGQDRGGGARAATP